MKIPSTLLALFIFSASYAQNSPFNVNNQSGQPVLSITSSIGYGSILKLQRFTPGVTPATFYSLEAGAGSNDDLRLVVNTWQTPLMSFKTDGNIGINNSSPAAQLDVKSNGNAHLFLSTSRTFSTSRSWGIVTNRITEGDFAVLSSNTNTDIPSNLRFLINPNGDVGINNNSPTALLDVKSGGRAHLVLSTSRGFSTSRNWGMVTNWIAEGDFGVVTSSTNTDVPSTMRFWINPNGNVGIGTTNVDAKLTVAGDIHSREVRVTVDAGADFVFDDHYELKPLSEVENFIRENKHLPDVESAKDMEENGVELGKMDMKLLQKVEELTLYVIEIKKEVAELRAENKELRDAVNRSGKK